MKFVAEVAGFPDSVQVMPSCLPTPDLKFLTENIKYTTTENSFKDWKTSRPLKDHYEETINAMENLKGRIWKDLNEAEKYLEMCKFWRYSIHFKWDKYW